MKQFSIILILVSAVLGIASHVINYLNLIAGGLDILSNFSVTYAHFGELTLTFAFLGFYLCSKSNINMRYLAVTFVLLGFFHFLIIEFGFIPAYGVLSVLLFMAKMTVFVLFILQYRHTEMDALTIKGYALSGVVGLYLVAMIVVALISTSIDPGSSFDAVNLVLPIFYVVFQIALYVFFVELYREIYHYKNEYYANL